MNLPFPESPACPPWMGNARLPYDLVGMEPQHSCPVCGPKRGYMVLYFDMGEAVVARWVGMN